MSRPIGSAMLKSGMLFVAVLSGLLLAPSPAAAQRSIGITIGYRSEKPNARPRRVDLNNNIYYLDIATTPPDRDLIRRSEVFYIDEFPEAMEFFRDDMEAFHRMIYDGGLLVLLADGDSPARVLDNFDYLGTRFDFSYSTRTVAGAFTPDQPRKGPLNGNVWSSATPMRPLQLRSPEWRVWNRAAESGEPVVATRRIGRGLLMVLGTKDIDRSYGGRSHNSLTLIEWGLRELQSPSPPAPAIAEPVARLRPGSQPPVLTEAERERVLRNPSSDLLKDRIAELRRVYARPAPADPDRKILIPAPERRYFPYQAAMTDSEGNLFRVSDFNGPPMLVVVWASWDPKSRRLLEENAELFRQAYGQGVTMLALSLDRDIGAARGYADSLGFFSVLICEEAGWRSAYANELGIDRIPRLILADGQGRICAPDLHVEDLAGALLEVRSK